MLLVIDNYDSFTYNLFQYLGELGAEMEVYRNNKITVDEIREKDPSGIVISPGPGRPEDGGVSLDTIKEFSGKIPILGVCLGHQCIGQAFGGKVLGAGRIMHGKTSMITHNNEDVFKDVPNPFQATRYHSLVVERESLPDVLEVTADSEQGELMGLRHREHPTWGVQFHPESILTGEGKKILANFLKRCNPAARSSNLQAQP
jgi:anthranilate synthase/aminodeoxychorismate synthase-like glutamine amidotransferase